MWAKGPMPGYSPKSELLKLIPTAVCEAKVSVAELMGYVVYHSRGGVAISSAGNARDAWDKALRRVASYDAAHRAYVKRA